MSVCLLLLLCSRGWAADPTPAPLSHIGIENGLSNNSVRCIYQDHQGYMWFGTFDGLNRYDGYEFKVFRYKPDDSTSLPHNYIYDIQEDSHHNLWVSTGQGIGIYNSISAQFSPAHFISYISGQRRSIYFNTNLVRADEAGNVFIGGNGWGLLVKKDTATNAMQLPCMLNGKLTTGYTVQDIVIDQRQQVWLFIRDVGLCRYDYNRDTILLIDNTLRSVNCMKAGKDGSLWIGTSNGLHRYDMNSGKLADWYSTTSGGLTSDNVVCLFPDKNNTLWIGTDGGGINILNLRTHQMRYLLPGEGENSIASESVFAIYEDNESRKWLGTIKGGVDIIDAQKSQFRTVRHNPLNSNSLINNFVSSFYEDGQQRLWVGTDGGGMSVWDRATNHFTNYRHEPSNPSSLTNNVVTSISQDYMGDTWVATYGGGVDKLNHLTGRFEHYPCIDRETGEENDKAWVVYEDHDKELWVTTFSNGWLYRLDRSKNRFDIFDHELMDLLVLAEDRQGNLWTGNSHQLIQVNRNKGGQHEWFEIGKPVRAIYEDGKGRLWIGTEGGGLMLFDRTQKKVVERFTDAQGLCNNAVINILEDGQGRLWLSTFNGLSRFNPAKRSFKNFYQTDGLQSNQFAFNAALKLHSGELAFGGIHGFSVFYPDSVRSRSFMPPVVMTGIRVNNSPLSDQPDLVKEKGNEIDRLVIPYNKAFLSFDFAALEYTSPGKISYAYFLEGWDKDWNYTGNVRTVNYNNIREGHYVFRVKSTNGEGVWNTKETLLSITILPPWYRTWWAYFIYLLLVVGIIGAYSYYKSRQRKLEYQVTLARLNAEKEKEINERKLSFFTHVSHEFRTPLMLIINPLREILQHGKVQTPTSGLKIVYRNASRLLSLVDQLLLFKKADDEGAITQVARLNFSNLCKRAFDSFAYQADNKSIQYQLNMPDQPLELAGDREKLEVILYNLLSNAFKYTPDNGAIKMTVEDRDQDVVLTVTDTGIGIPPEVGDALFEKFYRADDEKARRKAGFGIGLYLVKLFADNHHAVMTYQSEQGKGTTFNIRFKKGTAHFGNIPVVEETGEETFFLEELAAGQPEETEVEDTAASSPEAAPPPNLLQKLEETATSRQTMLVIDDNTDIREYIKGIFNDTYIIYEAGNGTAGLQMAREHLPDIIISDIMMDGKNGIELCRTIKENPALNHIPIILITANASAEVKLQGIEGGADDYITKPFEKEMLVARVTTLLNNRNKLQKYFYNEVTLKTTNLRISEDDKAFVDRCIEIVENRLLEDDFNIARLAMEMGMSHSNLYKKIKSVSGLSINGFIRFIRLRKAAELLINGKKNVNEAAVSVGFNDIKYFREQFYKLFGMNPSDYARKYRDSFNKNLRINPEIAGRQ